MRKWRWGEEEYIMKQYLLSMSWLLYLIYTQYISYFKSQSCVKLILAGENHLFYLWPYFGLHSMHWDSPEPGFFFLEDISLHILFSIFIRNYEPGYQSSPHPSFNKKLTPRVWHILEKASSYLSTGMKLNVHKIM